MTTSIVFRNQEQVFLGDLDDSLNDSDSDVANTPPQEEEEEESDS